MKAIKQTVKVSAATLLAWLVAGIASAQTTTNSIMSSSTVQHAVHATSSGSTTPGIPNTGAGGDVLANIFLLATSAAIALIGLAYLGRRWANS